MQVHHEPPGPVRLVGLAGLTAAALLLHAGTATAQDEGSIVITGREELQWLHLEDIRASIETYFQRRIDEVEAPDGDTTRDTEDRLREQLNLETEGFVGHPNLIELDLSVGLRFEQLWLDSDTQDADQTSYENFWEYDVSALILKESKAPLTLYSRRRQTTIDRQFGGSLDNTLTEHGARLRVRDKTLPSLFQYFHREQDQTSFQGRSDFDLTQDTVIKPCRRQATGSGPRKPREMVRSLPASAPTIRSCAGHSLWLLRKGGDLLGSRPHPADLALNHLEEVQAADLAEHARRGDGYHALQDQRFDHQPGQCPAFLE